MKAMGVRVGLVVVRDPREYRAPATPEELGDFATDVLAGFVLAHASAGLADGTIRSDVGHLELARAQALTTFIAFLELRHQAEMEWSPKLDGYKNLKCAPTPGVLE